MGVYEICSQFRTNPKNQIAKFQRQGGANMEFNFRGGFSRSNEKLTPGQNFGRSIEDLFNHSWRAVREPAWIWVPKPILLVGIGYPAHDEEVRREGWKARHLVRVHPPSPLTRSFAAVASSEMSRDNRRQQWGSDFGGGEKRR